MIIGRNQARWNRTIAAEDISQFTGVKRLAGPTWISVNGETNGANLDIYTVPNQKIFIPSQWCIVNTHVAAGSRHQLSLRMSGTTYPLFACRYRTDGETTIGMPINDKWILYSTDTIRIWTSAAAAYISATVIGKEYDLIDT